MPEPLGTLQAGGARVKMSLDAARRPRAEGAVEMALHAGARPETSEIHHGRSQNTRTF